MWVFTKHGEVGGAGIALAGAVHSPTKCRDAITIIIAASNRTFLKQFEISVVVWNGCFMGSDARVTAIAKH